MDRMSQTPKARDYTEEEYQTNDPLQSRQTPREEEKLTPREEEKMPISAREVHEKPRA